MGLSNLQKFFQESDVNCVHFLQNLQKVAIRSASGKKSPGWEGFVPDRGQNISSGQMYTPPEPYAAVMGSSRSLWMYSALCCQSASSAVPPGVSARCSSVQAARNRVNFSAPTAL